ncbi:MAG: hypothetical protein IKC14_00590 [Kiritimatiellae bacterium]|nr:hypothetical protein [Kiritimatiellia bacterium]
MSVENNNNNSMSLMNGNQEAQAKSFMMKPTAKSRIGLLFWVAAAILVTVASFRFGGRISGEGPVIAPEVVEGIKPTASEVEALQKRRQVELEQQKLELEKKKFAADVELRIQKYKGDVAVTVERYRKMVPLSEAEAAFRKCENGAAFIASKEGLCGFKCCVSLAYKMAYDKVKGTTRTEDAISPIVREKIVDEIEKAVAVYARWTADFQKELATEEAALAADLAVKSKSLESAVSVLSEENAKSVSLAVDAFSRDVQDHANKATSATVGLAAETVMIKTSYAAIKNVVVRLAGVALSSAVKRAGTSLAAGGTAAVVDGPLPIGDIIGAALTVGGLSWTAYDIYVVTKTMPDEMNAKIQEELVQTRKALEEKALANLQKAKLDCEASAEQKLSELNKILKGE